MGRAEEACAALAPLLARHAEDPELIGLWGQALLVGHRGDEALPYLERAERALKNDADLEFALGLAHGSRGEFAAARDALARAVAIDPTFYEGWLRLAQASHLAGDAGTRERALARADALPESRDGRAAALRARLAVSAP
jgi:predicted Zn-dependent protease